jgi:aminoglycoside phosphotransferase (APT) family kinase protein
MHDVIVAPEVRDLSVLAGQLVQWLKPKMPDAREIRILNLAYPFGAGKSHETILFDMKWSEAGQDREQGCVVRIKPTRHLVFLDDLFDQQYQVMRALHEQGRVRVAKPLWFESDPTLLGAPFFVMEKCHGRVAVSTPPYRDVGWLAEATAAQREKVWQNGVRQLAAVQQTPLDSVQFLRGPDHAADGLAQEWDKYVRFINWITSDGSWPLFQQALDGLRARWPKHQPPGLVWGDARIGNVMFDDRFEVVAVMDWEQPSLGGALHDLAWWLILSQQMHGATPTRQHLSGMGTRDETIALWREVTGIATDDMEWYEDFAGLKLNCVSIRMAQLKGWPMPDETMLARRMGCLR